MDSPLIPFFYDEAVGLHLTGSQRVVSAFEIAQAVLNDSLDLLIEEPVMPMRLSLKMIRHQASDGYLVSSMQEAEELLFCKLQLRTLTFSDEYKGATHDNSFMTRANLVNMLVSACNRIGHVSRRGAGNVIFMGSMVLDELKRLSVAFEEEEHKAVGRWTDVGFFCSTARVYTGPIPHDEVYVSYVGRNGLIDGPVGLVQSNGDLYLIESRCPLNPAENFLNGFRVVLA